VGSKREAKIRTKFDPLIDVPMCQETVKLALKTV